MKHFLTLTDWATSELWHIIQLAGHLKLDWQSGGNRPVLKNKILAMIFQKPSLRTRVTFEAAMTQMGGHGIYLQPADIGLGKREPVKDVARNLSRWCQPIMARTFAHQTILDLAQYADIPVINALSDREHPCQALADFQTLREHKGNLRGLTLTYVGDGNNVAHSLMLLGAKLGTHVRVACPVGYEPNIDITERARQIGAEGLEFVAGTIASVELPAMAAETRIHSNVADLLDLLPRLRIRSGERAGSILQLRYPETRFGRAAECDYRFDEESGVSRLHCAIQAEGGRFRIRDLGSTNGTLVNGNAVAEMELRHGDVIVIGEIELEFLMGRGQ